MVLLPSARRATATSGDSSAFRIASRRRGEATWGLARSFRQYPFDPNDELPGDIGAAFAAGANVGPAINAASARAAISTFMTRLRLWTVVLIWTSAPIGRRLRTNMPSPGRAACDADHSLQNDSERFRTFRLGRQR